MSTNKSKIAVVALLALSSCTVDQHLLSPLTLHYQGKAEFSTDLVGVPTYRYTVDLRIRQIAADSAILTLDMVSWSGSRSQLTSLARVSRNGADVTYQGRDPESVRPQFDSLDRGRGETGPDYSGFEFDSLRRVQ